ncbi:GntR family transcriptional regulator [Shimia isoporae]|uniref:GntR family transcriptional regulator n=1 Tax=Shimia isoporae TaxID=647720 RepID=A0A4R1NP01_9RHOB|nr:FCD domain-containing protein [Shimia isoporae]TCL08333.1 GntR family transcriptional regulator [Shimia isoporae]
MNISVDTSQGNQSSTQRTYLTLRNEIITGRLTPGERLKVDTLKENYGTGASPIREALSLLTSDQLVERLDQRGFRVAETSRHQFQEILNLRCTLEDMALRQSVANGGQEWEEQLVLVHHYMGKTDRAEQELFEERHKNFHMALISACESPILMRFCGQLYDLNVRYRFLAGRSKSYSSRNVEDEHQAILDAAVARDVELSSRLLMDHYRSTGAFLSDLID